MSSRSREAAARISRASSRSARRSTSRCCRTRQRIARAYFGPAREVVAILPRGNPKTTLAAKIGLHHLLTVRRRRGHDRRRLPRPGADRVRADARLHVAPRARRAADRPAPRAPPRRRPPAAPGRAVRGRPRPRPLVVALHRRRDLGVASRRRAARSDADRPDQAARREVPRDLHGRGAARFAARPDARPRARPAVRRSARAPSSKPAAISTGSNGSLPDDASLDDLDAVKACNPAPCITIGDLRRQRAALPSSRVRAVPRLPWGVGEGSWLPPGAGRSASAPPRSPTASRSGSASTSAANDQRPPSRGLTNSYTPTSRSTTAHGGVLEVVDHVRSLAGRYTSASSSMTRGGSARPRIELEREGLQVVEFPQTRRRA